MFPNWVLFDNHFCLLFPEKSWKPTLQAGFFFGSIFLKQTFEIVTFALNIPLYHCIMFVSKVGYFVQKKCDVIGNNLYVYLAKSTFTVVNIHNVKPSNPQKSH